LFANDSSRFETRKDLVDIYTNVGFARMKAARTDDALQYFSKATAIADQLASAEPHDLRARRSQARIYQGFGHAYVMLAQRSKAARTNWEKALDAYLRCSAIYQELKSKDMLKPLEASKLDELTKEIAKSDAALAKSQLTPDFRIG